MLKSILKERNITLTELSKSTGISLKVLSAFQNQKTDGVQYNTLDKIAKVLNIEVGKIIRRVDNTLKLDLSINGNYELDEKNQCNIDALLTTTDVNDNTYQASLNFDIQLKTLSNRKQLLVHINNLDCTKLPIELNNYINNELNYNSTKHGFYYLVSHLIIQELFQLESFSGFNIYDDVKISWRKLLPRYLINDINADAITYENERIHFIEQEYDINLVPLNPDTILEEHNPNLNIPYTANMEDLAYLSIIYKIDIEENYKRTIYISLD